MKKLIHILCFCCLCSFVGFYAYGESSKNIQTSAIPVWDSLQKAEKLAGENPSTENLYNYILLLIESEDYQNANKMMNKLKKNSDGRIKALNAQALIYIQQNNYKTAKRICQQIIDSKQMDLGHNCMGNALLSWKRATVAIDEFQATIKQSPNNADAYLGLGNSYRMSEKQPEAIEAYKKTIDLDPNNGVAYLGLGLISIAKGDQKKGLDYLRKGITVDPDCSIVHYNLGKVLGDTSEGLSELKKAVIIRPRWSSALIELGDALLRTKQYEEGVLYLKEAVKIEPTQSSAWVSLGEGLYKLGNYVEADSAVRKAISLAKTLSNAYLVLGEVLMAQSNYEEAENQLKLAIDYGAQNAPAYFKMGELMRNLDRKTVAISYLEKSSQIDPQFAAPEVILGDIYFERRNWDEAKMHYDEANRRKNVDYIDTNHLKQRLEQLSQN